ncbi:MAG TPA: hypothetical protein VF765_37545 [Polyangiaceae bacterium]
MEPRCVVLVPAAGSIEPECETALRELERRGYAVRRVSGYAAIDVARSQMATDALADGFEELMWIDSDVGFDPDDVDTLRGRDLPIVCAIYPKKGMRALACHVKPGTHEIVFGEQGGLLPILYAATGFLLTRRAVYDDVRRTSELPICNTRRKRPLVPYFMPMVVADGPEGHWYLGEDFAFCERARRAGYEIVADTTVRLRHYGRFGYSWEDAGMSPARYASFKFNVT